MIQTKKIGKLTEISVESGYIHKIGTETYFKRGIMLASDSIEMFEVVDRIPAYTKDQYDKKVAELVREKYSADEEFAIQRKMINSINEDADEKAVEEYNAYNTFVEECKKSAKNEDLYKEEIIEDNGE